MIRKSITLLGLLLIVFLSLFEPSTASVPWRPPSFLPTAVFQKKPPLAEKQPKASHRIRVQKWIGNVAAGVVEAGPRTIHHILYWLTAADALQSVIHNQYTDFVGTVTSGRLGVERHMVPSVYSRLFYFARLRPRLLYSVGALLRALQLCTPMGRILDPSIGVGAGINCCAILASSRWVKPLVLGWATTKYVWKWLGAKRVERAYLPITLSIREWEEQKAIKKKAKKKYRKGDSSD